MSSIIGQRFTEITFSSQLLVLLLMLCHKNNVMDIVVVNLSIIGFYNVNQDSSVNFNQIGTIISMTTYNYVLENQKKNI